MVLARPKRNVWMWCAMVVMGREGRGAVRGIRCGFLVAGNVPKERCRQIVVVLYCGYCMPAFLPDPAGRGASTIWMVKVKKLKRSWFVPSCWWREGGGGVWYGDEGSGGSYNLNKLQYFVLFTKWRGKLQNKCKLKKALGKWQKTFKIIFLPPNAEDSSHI